MVAADGVGAEMATGVVRAALPPTGVPSTGNELVEDAPGDDATTAGAADDEATAVDG